MKQAKAFIARLQDIKATNAQGGLADLSPSILMDAAISANITQAAAEGSKLPLDNPDALL